MRLFLACLFAAAPLAAADRAVDPLSPAMLQGIAFRSTFAGGQLHLDGQQLDALGRGNFGIVYDHPRADGVVLKLADHSPEILIYDPARTHEQTALLEEAAAKPLAEAGVGPAYYGRAQIGGRPVSAREKVYGETLEGLIAAKRYGRGEHALVLKLLDRIAESGLFPEDVRAPNIMIGTTLREPERRAYVVDSTRLKPVDPALTTAQLREALYRQPTTVARRHDPFVGDVVIDKPFNEILDKALGVKKPWRQRVAEFFSDLLAHMGSPAP